MQYDINNWYWKIKETGQVYSSAGHGYVAENDATYTTWKETGGIPSNISAADLAELMNGAIDDAIAAVEAKVLRSLRDVALGHGDVVSGGLTALQRIQTAETDIAALRAQRIH